MSSAFLQQNIPSWNTFRLLEGLDPDQALHFYQV